MIHPDRDNGEVVAAVEPSKPGKRILDFSDYSEEIIAQVRLPDDAISKEESIELLSRLHREMEAVDDYILRLRWCMGLILAHTHRPYGLGGQIIESIITSLWNDHQIRASRTLMYECERLYRVFGGRFSDFMRWVAEQKVLLGRPVYWSDIRRLCLGGRNNPDVIGRDAADQQDYRDAERGIEAIERIMARAREGVEEAQGVVEGIRQSIAGLLITSSGAARTPRSEKYVAFVRSYPCIVCARPAESHHAFGRRGVSIKPSDFACVPLCHVHHM